MCQFTARTHAPSLDPETTLKLLPGMFSKVKSGTYDFEANKALLKLYQFFPDLCKPETVALLLAKVCHPAGMMSWPARMAASRQPKERELMGARRNGEQ